MLRGHVHPDFHNAAEALEAQIPRERPGGAALCIYHRGEPVVDCWAGTRDEEGSAWEAETVSLSFSTTKGVASTLLHIMADRGQLDYDDPVAEYWPEFSQAGKDRITIRQVMCHEAGLYDIRSLVDTATRMLDWGYMVEALADGVPAHEPGAAHGYHGFTYGWLVGELVQRVSGRSFNDVLKAEIADPLELDGLFVGVPAEHMHRRAQLLLPGVLRREGEALERLGAWVRGMNRLLKFLRMPLDLAHLASALIPRGIEALDFNSEAFAAASIPAANGMFTARSLAKLYAVLANDGELGGVRLLERATVWRASEIQNRGIGRVIPVPMHWRLGYHRVPTVGVKVPNGFGHFGFGGSGAWADPDRNLSVAMTLNSGVGTPFGDLRMVRVGTAAARCADRR